MSRRFHALVHWAVPPTPVLRELPDVRQHVDLAHFPEDGPTWPAPSAWSVVLEFDRPPREQGSPSAAIVSFLVDAAPHERLRPGRRFDWYRGLHKLGEVEIGAVAGEA